MKISVIVPTVLGNYPLWAAPNQHVLDYVPSVIAAQQFPMDEVEVIIVDALWQERKAHFEDHSYPFDIIHIPPATGWVIRNRRTNHAIMRNTALCFANGELVFLVDDTLSFPPNTLTAIWREYERGYSISPLVEWRCGPDHVASNHDWRVSWLIEQKVSRWETQMDPERGHLNPIGFGIISYPLEVALGLGGYDELYDAGNQYIDTSFGIRLAAYGQSVVSSYKGLAIDGRYWCRHEAHELPDPRAVVTYSSKMHSYSMFSGAIKCNRTIYHLQKQLGFPRIANAVPLTREVYQAFQHCPFYEQVTDSLMDGDGTPALQKCKVDKLPCKLGHLARQGETAELAAWVREGRTFDLREWREVVRASV